MLQEGKQDWACSCSFTYETEALSKIAWLPTGTQTVEMWLELRLSDS